MKFSHHKQGCFTERSKAESASQTLTPFISSDIPRTRDRVLPGSSTDTYARNLPPSIRLKVHRSDYIPPIPESLRRLCSRL
jgi:hypothetical protein